MASKYCRKEVSRNKEYLVLLNDDETSLNEEGSSDCSGEDAQNIVLRRNIQEIREILRLVEKHMGIGYKCPEEKEFPIIIGNIQNMMETFCACTNAGKDFVAVFPSWKKKREKTIEKLRELAEGLNTHRFNCNVSRLTASSVGIIGGCISIVGAALIPFTLGASTPLLISGAAVAGAAGATNVGTAITETVLMRNRFKDAQDLIEEDKKAFKILKKWFRHCEQFVKSVNEIVEFDVFANLLEGIQQLKSLYVNNQNQLDFNALVKFVVSFCSINSIPVVQIPKVVAAIVSLCCRPQFLKLMRDFHSSNIFLHEVILSTVKIALQVARAMDVGVDTVTTVLSAVKGVGVVSRPVAAAVANGVLGGLGVALDVTSVVLTSIDVHRGSRSERSQKIKEAIEHLKSEMTTLTQLNKELQNMTEKNK